MSTVEKYRTWSPNMPGTPVEITSINPAYVDELEKFAKEMARHIVETWRISEYAQCLYCTGGIKWPDATEHRPTCPVPRAIEYLKQK